MGRTLSRPPPTATCRRLGCERAGAQPSAIQSGSFGELFATKLTGAVYAQPLVFDGTVIVTTERAYAYGINASTGAIEWTRSFGIPFKAASIGCSDLKPYIGSTSTPVIDPATPRSPGA